jgi:hypothetical protein
LDGVPELGLYTRDSLRRAAKAFAGRFDVNLVMNGKFRSNRIHASLDDSTDLRPQMSSTCWRPLR